MQEISEKIEGAESQKITACGNNDRKVEVLAASVSTGNDLVVIGSKNYDIFF
ncbi:hypothetical protein PS874_03479 [Pseudomonas fluorescens]|jgi:hypothetical protein|nr:hypothetical protein PS850_03074 [Pseudomonas fluorescens]VVP16590.1 hypothetical protein PS874_03479 [Pseudomonas fluorescens]VVP44974.1 hypothetical protein PS903_04965 [Pseudomonas fluorescens]